LVNHKKWLAGFKKEVEMAKKMEADEMINEEIKRLRIKKKAEDMRKRIREEQAQPAPVFDASKRVEAQQTQEIPKKRRTGKVTFRDTPEVYQAGNPQNQAPQQMEGNQPIYESEMVQKSMPKALKKKAMPAWARTQEDNEQMEEIGTRLERQMEKSIEGKI